MAAEAVPADALDSLDRAIVDHLQEDGRRAYSQIAQDLGVPEATVRFRARRLMRDGVIRIQATPNPFRLGYEVLALVELRTTPAARKRVIEELGSWPEVVYLSSCTGRVDLIAQVVCRNHHDLYALLAERVAAVEGITATETLMELEVHKYAYGLPALARG
jgi:Lrp/AsnC family transcriptional regulator for asnA, asnC and gidA